MIVKVQLSQVSPGSAARQALVYDEARTVNYMGPCPEDILLRMGNRSKAFFHAKIDGQKRLSLGDTAGWQEW